MQVFLRLLITKKNNFHAYHVIQEHIPTKINKKRVKIALLVRFHQPVVQYVQIVERVNSKTKSRKHRAKIVLSIHLQMLQVWQYVNLVELERKQ